MWYTVQSIWSYTKHQVTTKRVCHGGPDPRIIRLHTQIHTHRAVYFSGFTNSGRKLKYLIFKRLYSSCTNPDLKIQVSQSSDLIIWTSVSKNAAAFLFYRQNINWWDRPDFFFFYLTWIFISEFIWAEYEQLECHFMNTGHLTLLSEFVNPTTTTTTNHKSSLWNCTTFITL